MKKLEIEKIEFSTNDRKTQIKLPTILDEKLAYLLGVQVGDGYLKKQVYGTKTDYFICYDGHSLNEKEWYNTVLKRLIKEIFNKEGRITKTNKGTIKLYLRSKAILLFLNKLCGISFSPKVNIDIPRIIKEANVDIKRAFLRGLADTDFSITFKKRKNIDYPVIYYQTYSKPLYESTKELLKELGFKVSGDYRKSRRYDKIFDSYYITISGRSQFTKWLDEIGFHSFNHITKYQLWNKIGHLPSGTNILQRYDMLEKLKGLENDSSNP